MATMNEQSSTETHEPLDLAALGRTWKPPQEVDPTPEVSDIIAVMPWWAARSLIYVLNRMVALQVNGEEISLQDVLRTAKWRQQLTFLQDAINVALIRQAAAQRGIEATNDEL
jgi:hypothetical protein